MPHFQMTYELIITEKPTAAKKIAEALADGKALHMNSPTKVPYYKITHGKKDIIVACAVGHLFSVAEKKKSFLYPSFDIEWQPTSDIDKKSAFSKKYVTTLKQLSKDAKEFTVACDYDIEGEVIGLNIVRYICKKKDARRMKFSTLLKEDLIEAYKNVSPTLDWGQALAGETRHYLDWMYGINLSRALTIALKKAGMFKILSTGRVQGPALKIIVEREEEIAAFKSQPYWQVSLKGEKHGDVMEFFHQAGDIWEKPKAETIIKKCKGQPACVAGVTAAESKLKPPFPFDLGTLQTESYRLFGYSPKDTLAVAQSLYLEGLTSYPRTSSQQYPGLDFKKILTTLGKQPNFKEKVAFLLKLKHLTPVQGKKTDPAHPAIYPTGVIPGNIGDRERRVYDLIVKRFFAVFGEDAIRETVTVTLAVKDEHFLAKGTRTIKKGWHDLYEPYAQLKEIELPTFKEGEFVKVISIDLVEKETQPPKRYTQASIVSELEKRSLGTKATRAEIVDGLIRRGFVTDKPVSATELGMQMIKIIGSHVPEIVDVQLTRSFEEEMEKIRDKTMTEEQVLDHAKTTLTKILTKFKKDEGIIGKELLESEKETRDVANSLGPCPKCEKGTLKVTFSRKTKRRFIACDQYPDCKTTFPLPQGGVIRPTDEVCETCKHPLIIMKKPRSTQKICVNAQCPNKHVDEEVAALEALVKDKPCPKCGKPLLVRSSMYGKFIGCSGYPACKHIEKIKVDDGKKEEKRENE
jgi:DNA topoisomerase-1